MKKMLFLSVALTLMCTAAACASTTVEYNETETQEEEKTSAEDPIEVADNTESFASGPAIIEVSEFMESMCTDGEAN